MGRPGRVQHPCRAGLTKFKTKTITAGMDGMVHSLAGLPTIFWSFVETLRLKFTPSVCGCVLILFPGHTLRKETLE